MSRTLTLREPSTKKTYGVNCLHPTSALGSQEELVQLVGDAPPKPPKLGAPSNVNWVGMAGGWYFFPRVFERFEVDRRYVVDMWDWN